MAISGLFFAFFRGWFFSLLLLAAFPVMMICMGGLTKAMHSGYLDNLKAYG